MHKRLKYLLDKYLAKNISFQEKVELFDLISSHTFDDSIKRYLLKEYKRNSQGDSLKDSQSERILSSILNNEDLVIKTENPHWIFQKIWWAAAIVIITSGIILFYTHSNDKKYNESLAKSLTPILLKNDVAPGSNGAILKLADGTQVLLDSNTNKSTIKQGNTLVVNHAGSLNYININDTINEKSIGYNMVETQRGQKFHLSLEDGTKVWLNAASSISFPVAFTGNKRDVTITGEVYFEVAKNNRKPFRVFVNGTTVEDLGTHFNINSYGDEGTVNTTLLEGSVKISNADNQSILKPGDQARVRKNGMMTTISNINTDEIVAWKNNFFSFNNIDIKRVMMQLSRWYDIEVVYKQEPDESVTFNGDISRLVNLSTVLKMLESTGEVTFSIEDKKVTVSM
ncbi:MAG TPA: FecR family protein [Hanamia sp.]|nr:FecR family protein [Hanamia sp.]